MPSRFTRREFLTAAVGATTLSLGGCLPSTESCPPGANDNLGCALPPANKAPFDTVVVLMMENRSFDHFLGWLPGANGRQRGLHYVDESGLGHDTWALAPDFQGCQYQDPDHTWMGIATQYADGRCDGFLKTRTDRRRLSARTTRYRPARVRFLTSNALVSAFRPSRLDPLRPARSRRRDPTKTARSCE